MLSVKGIYEEGKVKLLEKVQSAKRSKVIITFVEDMDLNEEEKLGSFSANDNGLDFWKNDAEDIYKDYLLSV
jgi:hypothetical protein